MIELPLGYSDIVIMIAKMILTNVEDGDKEDENDNTSGYDDDDDNVADYESIKQ